MVVSVRLMKQKVGKKRAYGIHFTSKHMLCSCVHRHALG
uniref:Uncharacterized protein n=1 Tax=Klebsiella pneumoniae TaxID=573 RepID=A0A482M3X5_KLEPN|nr:hypothetical protein [Klebsiella pneumoniae]